MREIRTKNGKVRRYRSEEEISGLLEAFRASGLSRTEFARSHDINLNVLSGWIKRAASPAEGAPVLHEVSAAATVPFLRTGWAAEVALPSGVALRLSAEADSALAERLWKLISR